MDLIIVNVAKQPISLFMHKIIQCILMTQVWGWDLKSVRSNQVILAYLTYFVPGN